MQVHYSSGVSTQCFAIFQRHLPSSDSPRIQCVAGCHPGDANKLTADGLAVAHCQRVLKVKHGLLPVRVPRPGPGAEPDGLVAAPELDVKVADQGVDEVVAAGRQLEGRLRGANGTQMSESSVNSGPDPY